MNRPVFRVEQESTDALRDARRALLLKDVVSGTEDATLLAMIRDELTSRALGQKTEAGWPTALDDPTDDGLPWQD